eukprot:7525175-Pyramimonas_sp.AAC.1
MLSIELLSDKVTGYEVFMVDSMVSASKPTSHLLKKVRRRVRAGMSARRIGGRIELFSGNMAY